MTPFEIRMSLRRIRDFARTQKSDSPHLTSLWAEVFRKSDDAYEAASRIEEHQGATRKS